MCNESSVDGADAQCSGFYLIDRRSWMKSGVITNFPSQILLLLVNPAAVSGAEAELAVICLYVPEDNSVKASFKSRWGYKPG